MRGGSPVTVPAWATRHGPIVHGSPDSGIALALKWTGTYRANSGFECMFPMLTAGSVAQMCDAQDGWVDPVNNLVCADVAGDIAYQCRGEVPVRSSEGGRRLPVAGWDGACEWTSPCRSASCRARSIPSAGYVMTANNAIVDGDAPYLSYTFAQPFRAERLRSLLDGRAALDRGRAGRDAGGHGLRRRPGMGAGARLARAVRGFRGCRGSAVTAGRVRRGPRGGVGGGAALRLLRPGAGGRVVPPDPRPRYLGLGRVGRTRADDIPGQAVARRRHVGAARDADRARWRARLGRALDRGRRASGVAGYSPRSRPRSPRPGRRPSSSAGRTLGSGGGGTSTRRSWCTRWARPRAAPAGSPACRWAATPTPSRRPGTAGGRAPRSRSPACRSTGRWWTWPTAGRPAL